jgi:CheY-like chemotaxis protein
MQAAEAVKRVLLVEDDAVTRQALALALRGDGYEVVPKANGREALDVLEAGPPVDLIVLDMLMPVLDGWHFLQKLTARHGRPAPVIVTTASILTREWALDHGCAGFLHKPVEPEALLAEARRCLTAQPPLEVLLRAWSRASPAEQAAFLAETRRRDGR